MAVAKNTTKKAPAAVKKETETKDVAERNTEKKHEEVTKIETPVEKKEFKPKVY